MRLLLFPDLKAEKNIPYSRCHLRRLIKARKFPAPIVLGAGRIAWPEHIIDDHIRDLIAESDARHNGGAAHV